MDTLMDVPALKDRMAAGQRTVLLDVRYRFVIDTSTLS